MRLTSKMADADMRAHVSAHICQHAVSVRFLRLRIRLLQRPNQFIHFLAASCRFELRARMSKCLHFCQTCHLVRLGAQRLLHNVPRDLYADVIARSGRDGKVIIQMQT